MNTSSLPPMNCSEFLDILPDYLEAHALSSPERAVADAHLARCAECAALVIDLRAIARDARVLPLRSPGRDLWSGIEARIEAPVVALPTKVVDTATTVPALLAPAAVAVAPSWRRFAIAASLLVAVTAGVTYTVATNSSGTAASRLVEQGPASGASPASGSGVRHASATETFDREIESLRKLVDDRRGELDPITVGVIEKNLKLIDRAITESKAALANDPANAFLSDRLTHDYDTKLQLMRNLATRPPRS